jgi:hypothetical protein
VNETMEHWLARLLTISGDVERKPPATPALIQRAEEELRQSLPDELTNFFLASNGLTVRSFSIYPVFDPANPQKTANSLQRINQPGKSDALGGNRDLLSRFLVFADIGDGYAVWDRSSKSIWYEEASDPDLRQTAFDFREFVETMAKNAE